MNKVRNPDKYFSRKGFNAINVQAIVDRDKHIAWCFIDANGSSHDSVVFKDTELYKYLMGHRTWLEDKGYYTIGEPFDNVPQHSPEDMFNFIHSSMRIAVECSFGKIGRRWGILWRHLEGRLQDHQYTIYACMKLHNFIVDYKI